MGESKIMLLLCFTVLFHMFVVIGNLIAFLSLPFLQPWYVALPLCTFIFWISLTRGVECPLTRFENYLRKEMQVKPIKGFMKHYFYEMWKD